MAEADSDSQGQAAPAEVSADQRVVDFPPPPTTTRGRKIPGNNAAYFCQPDKQPLAIEFIEISPFPPQTDQVQFILIKAYMSGYTEDALRDAKLRFRMTFDGTESGLTVVPLGAAYHIAVRQEADDLNEQYSQRLKPGWNEIIGDAFIPRIFWRSGTYTFDVQIILEPEEILASFTMEHFLVGELPPDN